MKGIIEKLSNHKKKTIAALLVLLVIGGLVIGVNLNKAVEPEPEYVPEIEEVEEVEVVEEEPEEVEEEVIEEVEEPEEELVEIHLHEEPVLTAYVGEELFLQDIIESIEGEFNNLILEAVEFDMEDIITIALAPCIDCHVDAECHEDCEDECEDEPHEECEYCEECLVEIVCDCEDCECQTNEGQVPNLVLVFHEDGIFEMELIVADEELETLDSVIVEFEILEVEVDEEEADEDENESDDVGVNEDSSTGDSPGDNAGNNNAGDNNAGNNTGSNQGSTNNNTSNNTGGSSGGSNNNTGSGNNNQTSNPPTQSRPPAQNPPTQHPPAQNPPPQEPPACSHNWVEGTRQEDRGSWQNVVVGTRSVWGRNCGNRFYSLEDAQNAFVNGDCCGSGGVFGENIYESRWVPNMVTIGNGVFTCSRCGAVR